VVTQYPGEEAAAMANNWTALVEAIDAYLNPKLPAPADDPDDQGDADDDPGSELKEGEKSNG
jgi:hypothetical protein